MKVLVIASWYPSIDAPTSGVFIRRQVEAIAASEDTAVLHVSTKGRVPASVSKEDDVFVVRAGIPEGRWKLLSQYARAGAAAFQQLRESWGEPDIIHVQALWPGGLIARALSIHLSVPYVVTEHSEEYLARSARRLVRTPGMLPLVLRPLARAAARTITVSAHLAARLKTLGLTSKEPVVIPNVVPTSPATPAPSEPPYRVLHVSIMGPAKNLPSLLRAVDTLRRKRTDFIVTLVGDGESRADVEQLAKSLDLDDFIEFVGSRSTEEVRDIRERSAFTVVSSSHETFSVVAAESLMSGRPVLSTRCGGPEEFVTPEVGRLVDVNNDDALAEGLDWMLDHFREFDPHALHEYARERFAPDVIAQQIFAVYREVLGG